MKNIETILKHINVTPDSHNHEKGLKTILKAQEQSNKTKPAANQPVNIGILIMKHNLTKLAAAAVILIALLITFNRSGVSPDGATIAWADVVEHFRAVTSFEATVYLKSDAISEPEQIELWVGKNGGTRLRSGSNVIFGKDGNVIRAYDIKTRKTTTADVRSTRMIGMMNLGEFSLNSIVDTMLQGRLKNVTPIVNMDENISADITVFDLESKDTRQWIRIWALRESKLPTRMKMLDPESGEAIDAVFTYSKDQPDEFYDANAYGKFMQKAAKSSTIVYGGLTDPDENDVSPNVRSDHEVLKVVTTTLDGQPWSVAEQLKDKNIVLFFWSLNRNYYANEIQDKYLKIFENRKDIIFASVVLSSDTNAVKNFVEKNNIPGLILHESGKGFNNSLAKALGVNQEGAVAVIEKDGSVFVSSVALQLHLKPMIDYIDNGLTYESFRYIRDKLMQLKRQPGNNLNQEYVEKLMGSKGTVHKIEGQETWEYKLVDKKKENEKKIEIMFDQAGLYVGQTIYTSIINPSLLKIKITKECWDKQIIPRFKAELLPANDDKNGFCIQVKKSSSTHNYPEGLQIGSGYPWRGIQPNKEYINQVRPNTYNLELRLTDKQSSSKDFGKVLLKSNIKLEVNKTVEIVIDNITDTNFILPAEPSVQNNSEKEKAEKEPAINIEMDEKLSKTVLLPSSGDDFHHYYNAIDVHVLDLASGKISTIEDVKSTKHFDMLVGEHNKGDLCYFTITDSKSPIIYFVRNCRENITEMDDDSLGNLGMFFSPISYKEKIVYTKDDKKYLLKFISPDDKGCTIQYMPIIE